MDYFSTLNQKTLQANVIIVIIIYVKPIAKIIKKIIFQCNNCIADKKAISLINW